MHATRNGGRAQLQGRDGAVAGSAGGVTEAQQRAAVCEVLPAGHGGLAGQARKQDGSVQVRDQRERCCPLCKDKCGGTASSVVLMSS